MGFAEALCGEPRLSEFDAAMTVGFSFFIIEFGSS
jgi:hypothetical protein